MKVVSVKVADIRPQYQDLSDWMKDSNNVYIGRRGIVFITDDTGKKFRYPPTDSIWANPYKVTESCSREQCIQFYRSYIYDKIYRGEITIEQIRNLENKTLGCWCKTRDAPHTPCHGDVLIELISKYC